MDINEIVTLECLVDSVKSPFPNARMTCSTGAHKSNIDVH